MLELERMHIHVPSLATKWQMIFVYVILCVCTFDSRHRCWNIDTCLNTKKQISSSLFHCFSSIQFKKSSSCQNSSEYDFLRRRLAWLCRYYSPKSYSFPTIQADLMSSEIYVHWILHCLKYDYCMCTHFSGIHILAELRALTQVHLFMNTLICLWKMFYDRESSRCENLWLRL